MKGSSYGLF